jgi:hypothetical protein
MLQFEMSPGAIGLLLCGVVLLALYTFLHFRNRNGEWREAGGNKMRRRVNGKWQYREMTDEEADEDWQARQW